MQSLNETNRINARFAIFSAESDHSEDRARDHDAQQILDRNNAQYKRVQGVYDGAPENAFLVRVNDPEHGAMDFHNIVLMARTYEQESILLLGELYNGFRQAYLYFVDPRTFEHIGRFRAVSESYAKACDAYTYDPSQDQYFVAD